MHRSSTIVPRLCSRHLVADAYLDNTDYVSKFIANEMAQHKVTAEY